MRSLIALGAALTATTMLAAPASAATVTYGAMNPDGVITLQPAGPGAVSAPFSFDVAGEPGIFTATFDFFNPFASATATGSASFDFDPDVVNFTSGSFGGGSMFSIASPGTGSAITVQLSNLTGGVQTLTLMGTLNPGGTPADGNAFARIGGSLNLVGAAGAVPEPTTWALFILGFGMIGGAMRRHGRQVRSTKAAIRFA